MKAVIFDTETTSPEPTEARLVTAFLGLWDTETEKFEQHLEFLINPGVPIPEEASAIHGITDEVASRGMNPVEALELMFYVFHDWSEYPHVAYNLPFDATVLNCELERYGYTAFDWTKRQLIDPLVLERHFNKYKKGKKRLMDVAAQRGITLDESRLHAADYDSEITARVVTQQIQEWGMPTNEEQAQYHAEWANSFQSYLRRVKNDATLTISGDWPTRQKED